MSFGSIWSITQSPSSVACRPFGCLPGVFQSTRGSTFEAMSHPPSWRPPFWHSACVRRTAVAELRIGTSGWIYRHWKGIFYPDKLPQKSWFEHYRQQFDTVEINFTFYRLPERSVFERWWERAPANFRYAVKGSRVVTHVRRLREPEEGVGRLAERLEGPGGPRGPVLWQLPPDLPRDDELLARFLAALPGRWRH